MRQVSKIGVIILVLAIIIFIVVKAFSKTDDESGEIVTKHNLVKAVEQRADNDIVDKAYADANPAYNDLLNMLKTEEGQGNYPPEDIEQGRKIAVRASAPIFADYAKSYFNSTGWGGAKVNEIKAET
ncbi:MAG: hypothetical protein IK092_07040, partial [Muribaculaceae bacterium]|nr:hypothetical protein [Muribaculaceae bacterium]